MEIINFKIRKSNNNDQKLIWKWRNDPESRLMFFNTSVVSWEEHLEWYNEIESDKNKLCLVAENNGQLLCKDESPKVKKKNETIPLEMLFEKKWHNF